MLGPGIRLAPAFIMNPACTGYPAAQLVDGKPGVWYTEETTIKRGIIMEETRSFGYICPKCGRAVMARRSAFSLAAAAAHIECPCGESDMLIETDGSKFHGSNFFTVIQRGELRKPFVGNGDYADVRFYRAERKVCRLRACMGDCIEKSGFADVGQSYYA